MMKAVADLAPPGQGFSQVIVQWNSPTTPVFCRGVMELDSWRNLPSRINDHRPRQVRDFPSAEPSFHRQQDNHPISNRIPRGGGVGKEGVYVVIKQNFCLLPCHYLVISVND